MAFGKDNESEKLQALVKSCLLEINKLKMDLVNVEKEKDLLKNDDEINRLNSLLTKKEEKVNELKLTLEKKETIISKNTDLISSQNDKIEELKNFKKSFNEIKESLEENLENFKINELNEQDQKLKSSLLDIEEKDKKIKYLSDDIEKEKKDNEELKNKVDSFSLIIEKKNIRIENLLDDIEREKTKHKDLESELETSNSTIEKKDKKIDNLLDDIENEKNRINNIKTSSKEDIFEYQQKIDEKDQQIKLLSENNISKDSYLKLEHELKLKDEQIKNLEKIKDLVSDFDNKFSFEEENLPEAFLSLINSEKSMDNIVTTEEFKDLDNKDINKIKKELILCKKNVNELEEVKNNFDKLLAPPKNNLSSFQSQIYNLIPETKMSTQEIHNYIRRVGFRNLTYINISNILKNLSRKGYLIMEEKDNNNYWIKTDKD